MVVLALGLIRRSWSGLVLRVTIGAVLSIVDAITDIYVVVVYYREGLDSQAAALLTMMFLNLSAQILLNLVQYRHSSWARIVGETVITLTFLRPAVDAFRVCTYASERAVAHTLGVTTLGTIRIGVTPLRLAGI